MVLDLPGRLGELARSCRKAAANLQNPPLADLSARLRKASEGLDEAWSGSWIGYHAWTYLADLRPRGPGDLFDPQWGLMTHRDASPGDWREFSFDEVRDELLRRAEVESLEPLDRAAEEARKAFQAAQDESVALLDAHLQKGPDAALAELRTEIAEAKSHVSRAKYVTAMRPGRILTRDHTAISQGLRVPHHLHFLAGVNEFASHVSRCQALARLLGRAETYLNARYAMAAAGGARPSGNRVFFGHGRSMVWRELKDFLAERLHLPWDEFNRESAAGRSIKERLQQMLDQAAFAFLVMTGEDEHADSSIHARENVIHETGLFQGRLGFERAIVLLEDGCRDYSNVSGITYISFPKGKISAVFEELRRVLEREGVVAAS